MHESPHAWLLAQTLQHFRPSVAGKVATADIGMSVAGAALAACGSVAVRAGSTVALVGWLATVGAIVAEGVTVAVAAGVSLGA
jgi:UDP-3-O-[3-hydroxymyristoyl] glucosamine N-acyltransferase